MIKESLSRVKRLTDKHKAMLDSGRLTHVTAREYLLMSISGKRDGQKGLPCQSADGTWTSPFIDMEIKQLYEYDCKIWGELQIASDESFVEMSDLINSFGANLTELNRLEESRNKSELSTSVSNTRKKGEENLSESQIQARRQREDERRRQPLLNKLSEAEAKMSACISEISDIYGSITEARNLTVLVYERVMQHSLQRIDIYWRSAFIRRTADSDMPVLPDFVLPSRAEIIFNDQHCRLLQEAEELLNRFKAYLEKDNTKEVAVPC